MKEIFKKVINRVPVYFVSLPEASSFTYTSVIFKSGYLDEEDDEFGYGHLLEHYIASDKLHDKQEQLDISGSTGDSFIGIYSRAKTKVSSKHLEILLDRCFNPPFDKKDVLGFEKLALENEILTKYHDLSKSTWDKVKRLRFKKAGNFNRPRITQLKNTNKASLNDIQDKHRFLLDKHPFIVIASHNLNDKQIGRFSKIIKERSMDISARNKKSRLEAVEYSSRGIFDEKISVVAPRHARVYITFPGLGINSKLEELLKSRVCNELMSWSITKKIRSEGVYDVGNSRSTYHNSGTLGFYSESWISKLETIGEYAGKEMALFKKGVIDKKDFKDNVQSKIERTKSQWNRNGGRINWVTDDIIDHDKIISPDHIVKVLEGISVDDIQKVAKKYYRTDNLNIISFSKSGKSLSKDVNKALEKALGL